MDTRDTTEDQQRPQTSSQGVKRSGSDPIRNDVPAKRPKGKSFTKGAPKKQQDGAPSKRAIATFDKQKEKTVLFTFPILTFFSLHMEFTGAPVLSGILYDILHARDSKMTTLFSKRDFQYVTLLSAYYRTAQVVNSSRNSIILGLSKLKDVISDILLPDILCTYIEMIGIVNLSTGIKVVPYFRSYSSMRTLPTFVDAVHFLSREDSEDLEDGEWPICIPVILRVQHGLSRALKGILDLRTVKKEFDGSEALLASYRIEDHARIVPTAIQQMDVNTCTLGACLMFRSSDSEDHRGDLIAPPVHEAPAVDQDMFLTRWVLDSMRVQRC